ncbi:MAG TPA: ABC transporter ATP-binding protein [Candidatus Limnocylindria bacterium]|nr:ABC transporter ATP-binding protein [Candidatus Limnocylindria bacterium]
MSLRLEGVGYRYAGSATDALIDVDLAIEPGEVVGVCGPNAGGKSTLCLVAGGLAPLTIGGQLRGRVSIDGSATAGAKQYEVAQRVGILFQEPQAQLSDSVPTVWEEVAFGPRNLSLPLDEVVARTWGALEALDIADLCERDPGRLSGGQAQLVALASVLALQPAYLVLDEPTSQLDPEGTRLVAEALARAAAVTGAGILVVEHKTDLLARLCARLAIVEAGRIVKQGTAVTMLGLPELDELGVSPPETVRLRRAVEATGGHWDPSWT